MALRRRLAPRRTGTDEAGTRIAIAAEGHRQALRRVTALSSDVDLDVRRGELLALLGPRAPARRRCCASSPGWSSPTAGASCSAARTPPALAVRERRVGFVFQHYALFRHMTVAENIAFGLRVRPRRTRPADKEIRAPRRRAARPRAAARPRQALSGPALGRPAPARGAGPRARRRAARAAARRAVRRARRQGAQGPAALAARDPRPHRPHHPLRHPRPGGGARARRPRRHPQPRPASSRSARRTTFSTSRPRRSSRASSAKRCACRSMPPAPGSASAPHQVRTPEENVAGPAELFVRPRDLVIAEPGTDAIPARVIAVRRSGPARRAELAGRRPADRRDRAAGRPHRPARRRAAGRARDGASLRAFLTLGRCRAAEGS